MTFVSSFLHNRRPLCTILGEMSDAEKAMHPQHYGTDPVDIRMRVRINPAIRIGLPDGIVEFNVPLDTQVISETVLRVT